MQLAEFFAELDRHEDQVPIEALVDLLERVKLEPSDWQPHVAFSAEAYKRNLVKLGPGYSALVLCWKPGQASPIHDHYGSACAVRVLHGAVTETVYARGADRMLREAKTSRYEVGSVCGSYDADIHVITNETRDGDAPTDLVTLHVYTPPMTTYHVWTLDSPEAEERQDVETMAAMRKLEAQRI